VSAKLRFARAFLRLANRRMRAQLRNTTKERYALLETIGHRTRKPRQTPVAYERDRSAVWVVAIHGQRAHWVKNLLAHPDVRIKIGPTWYGGQAELVRTTTSRRAPRCGTAPTAPTGASSAPTFSPFGSI
jgi:deazaflavin-dependent oxidoreductase (nitroreductase family)